MSHPGTDDPQARNNPTNCNRKPGITRPTAFPRFLSPLSQNPSSVHISAPTAPLLFALIGRLLEVRVPKAVAGAAKAPPPPLEEMFAAALERSRLARAAVDAVLYVYLGAVWAFCVCFFPVTLGRGSPVADAVSGVLLVAMYPVGLLSTPFALLYGLRVGCINNTEAKPPCRSEDESPAPGRDHMIFALRQIAQVVALAIIICMPFSLFAIVVIRGERRIGGLQLADAGTLGITALLLFIIYPNLAERLWRVKVVTA